MFNFNFGKKIFLGVDIGTSAIKVVEFELRADRPYLSNYAWMPVDDAGKKKKNASPDFFETTFAEYLKKIIKEAKFKGKDVYISIPAFGGLITLIDFPEMPDEDMDQAIRYEAHKYIPTSLDEVALSWEVIKNNSSAQLSTQTDKKENESPSKNNKVLLVAASKSKIVTYEKVVKGAGLKPKGVEIESIPMVNALIGNDKGNFFILDIGFRTCNIIYIRKGVITANRNINAGGVDLTRTIAKSMKVAEEKAEAIKISDKNLFSAESNLQFPTLELISQEIERILENFFQNKNSSDVDAIILSGGTANLTGIENFFQKKFNIKTIIGDPFSRVDYNKKLKPALEKMRGPFNVCVGLALIGLGNYEK